VSVQQKVPSRDPRRMRGYVSLLLFATVSCVEQSVAPEEPTTLSLAMASADEVSGSSLSQMG